jgi:hypothetical protein
VFLGISSCPRGGRGGREEEREVIVAMRREGVFYFTEGQLQINNNGL